MFHADKMLGSFKKPCQKLRNYFGFTNPEVPPFEWFFLGRVSGKGRTITENTDVCITISTKNCSEKIYFLLRLMGLLHQLSITSKFWSTTSHQDWNHPSLHTAVGFSCSSDPHILGCCKLLTETVLASVLFTSWWAFILTSSVWWFEVMSTYGLHTGH